jgi:hypothetical protein
LRTVRHRRAGTRPPAEGATTFFYYHDLPAAVRWYESVTGFRQLFDGGWVAIEQGRAAGT